MSEFLIYLKLGFDHIVDPAAHDHLLFVVTLCAAYRPEDWKKILLLVTAFTIGHSLTLALSALDVLRLPSELVETLIPITILLTALHNIWINQPEGGTFSRMVSANYLLALFFGLIHGMGFANYFRTLMGEAGNVVGMLFPFNLGIELGQILIVLCFFGLLFLLRKFFAIAHRDWNLFVSGIGAGGALVLILQGIFEG